MNNVPENDDRSASRHVRRKRRATTFWNLKTTAVVACVLFAGLLTNAASAANAKTATPVRGHKTLLDEGRSYYQGKTITLDCPTSRVPPVTYSVERSHLQ